MRRTWGPSAVIVALLLALPRLAAAQAAPPADESIDLQNFDYSIGPKSFFSVDSADLADKKQLALDVLVTFMSNPFVVYNSSGPTNTMITGTRDQVVQNVTAMQLSGAYGLTDRLQLGAALPIVFSLNGKGLDPTTGMGDPNGLQVTGLGDLRLEAKYRLWQNGAFRLAGIGGLTLPTSVGSDGSKFIGDDLPTIGARAAAEWSRGRVSIGGDFGFVIRKPRTIYGSTVGDQLLLGVGAAVSITDKFSLIGESYGRIGLSCASDEPSCHPGALDESPIEALGGLRVLAATSFVVTVGGGAGLDRAIGAPNARFFASIGYAPDIRDSDGDGIPNNEDKCPLVPEDKDGFQDQDGCPDTDNDGDGVADADDKCPGAKEDIDGFQDEDGCPDPDNDKDGIPDLRDKCPNDAEDHQPPYPNDGCPATKHDTDGDGIPDASDKCPNDPEDMDGFQDADGCPDTDNDADGVPDDKDKCSMCPEDKDGFEDADGCPDLDNDHDGIPDAQDKCPNEPETVNGYRDDDGCPDTGGQVIVHFSGDRLDVDRVPPLDGRRLSASGQSIVDQMALVMRGHPEVTKWLVAISVPNGAEAKRTADAIKARLDAKGVPGVSTLGAGGPPKIGAIVQERAAPDAPMTCPASPSVKPTASVPAAAKPH